MAGDWIKIEHVTIDKPEVYKMSEILEIDPMHVVGSLLAVWIWADQQLHDGNADSVTKSLLDRKANVTNFSDAMLEVGWLSKTENGFEIPNFNRHLGNSAKKRAQTARRVAKSKAKSNADGNASTNADSVTKSVSDALPREEKRREEYKKENKNIKKQKKDNDSETDLFGKPIEKDNRDSKEYELFLYCNSLEGAGDNLERSFDNESNFKILTNAIKKHGLENCKKYIKRSSDAVLHSGHFYSVKWKAFKFFKQSNGVKEWTDDGQNYSNFLNDKEKSSSKQQDLDKYKHEQEMERQKKDYGFCTDDIVT